MVKYNVYKSVIKEFLGKDVRTVKIKDEEYVVIKDMFSILGRLDDDGHMTSWDNETLEGLLDSLGCSCKKCIIVSENSEVSSRKIQVVDCIPIEKTSITLLIFEPKTSDEEVNKKYKEFLRFCGKIF